MVFAVVVAMPLRERLTFPGCLQIHVLMYKMSIKKIYRVGILTTLDKYRQYFMRLSIWRFPQHFQCGLLEK